MAKKMDPEITAKSHEPSTNIIQDSKDTEGGIRSCSLQRSSSAGFVGPPRSWRPTVVGAGAMAMGATVTTGRVSLDFQALWDHIRYQYR